MSSPPTKSVVLARLGREGASEPDLALGHEWLETNGRGDFASSTPLLCPTRRQHGLLVGRPPGNERPHVFLSRFEEKVRVDGTATALSTAHYCDVLSPAGFEVFAGFELAPHPRSTYVVGSVTVVREILLVPGAPLVLCRYSTPDGADGLELELRPVLAMREADALTFENRLLDPRTDTIPGGVRFRPYPGLPALAVSINRPRAFFQSDPVWYRGVFYPEDARRGLPAREDQFSPGFLRVPLRGDVVVGATVAAPAEGLGALWGRTLERRRSAAEQALASAPPPPSLARLSLGAEDFLRRVPGGRPAVDACFPWPAERGRDALVALPGLLLARGGPDELAEALDGARAFLSDGLLPGVVGPTIATSTYDSADASLWFARAVALYEAAGGDGDRVLEDLLPVLVEIAEQYRAGTSLGIRADEDELVHVGAPDLAATWMDARDEDGPVTPRDGFPVEVEALWYAMLAQIERLCGRRGDPRGKRTWTERRRRARRAFLARFWLEDGEYLADRWKDGAADRSVRPNMVIAAALEESPLTRRQRLGVVRRAEAELVVPCGLRTLAPGEPAYRGTCAGEPQERARALHQGAAWPWLLGSYGEARLRAEGPKADVLAALRGLLEGFAPELDRGGWNHVAEVFDGAPPHAPGGATARAWNTGELLRLAALVGGGRP